MILLNSPEYDQLSDAHLLNLDQFVYILLGFWGNDSNDVESAS